MNTTRTSLSIISLISFMALAGFAYIAQAQEEELTPQERFAGIEAKMDERKENAEEKQAERAQAVEERKASTSAAREAKQEERVEKKAERKAALQARTQERITNLAANVSNRMEAAIARIRQIINRMETRAESLSERGVDTYAAEAELRVASAHLDDAENSLSGIDSLVTDALSSESPREAWAPAREIFQSAKASIKASHQSLRNTIALLKEAVRTAKLGNGVSDAVQQNDESNIDEGADEQDEVDPSAEPTE